MSLPVRFPSNKGASKQVSGTPKRPRRSMDLSRWTHRIGLGAVLAIVPAIWPAIVLASNSRPTWHPGGPFSPVTTPSSEETLTISNLFWITLVLSGIIFVGVSAALILSFIKFSGKAGDEDPKQVFGNRTIELIWTLIPTVILIAAFGATVYAIHSINTPAKGQVINIDAIGHQWWWEFHYPQGQGGIQQPIFTANEVHVPTGMTVHFHVKSADVIHSFWTPEIARQLDANPGQDNAIFVPALKTVGTFDGMCYEYCGEGHAWMRFRMIVQSPVQFQAWATHVGQVAAEPTNSLALAGKKVFLSNTCINCHNIAGTPAGAQVGPNLTHVGSRWAIGAGALAMTEKNLRTWIVNPAQAKPGALMPGYPLLTEKDLRALAAYLISLK